MYMHDFNKRTTPALPRPIVTRSVQRPRPTGWLVSYGREYGQFLWFKTKREAQRAARVIGSLMNPNATIAVYLDGAQGCTYEDAAMFFSRSLPIMREYKVSFRAYVTMSLTREQNAAWNAQQFAYIYNMELTPDVYQRELDRTPAEDCALLFCIASADYTQ